MDRESVKAELRRLGVDFSPRSRTSTLAKKLERTRLRATTPEEPRSFDSRGGDVNIWPILQADAPDLIAEIERGDHDAYLSFLAQCDRAQFDGRPGVQEAIRARMGG